MNNNELTRQQKFFLEELFLQHEEKMNKQYQEKVIPEIEALSKYKGELARAYEGVRGHKATLLECMKTLIDKQDELIGLVHKIESVTERMDGIVEFLRNPYSQEVDSTLKEEK